MKYFQISKELEVLNVNIADCSQVQASPGVICARTGSTRDTLCHVSSLV